jgi:hypothetical protein
MPKWVGLVFAGLIAGACGHATPTGSARNDWDTPTGYANATDPRYINPIAAAHPARNRSVFAAREAPPVQSAPAEEAAPAPVDAVPPPAETTPPSDTEGLPPCDKDAPSEHVSPGQP